MSSSRQVYIGGKCWRLVRNWYSNLVSQVKLGTHLSKPFNISLGIRQGSVLSPTLFNLVIDPLISTLKQRNPGVNINGLYLGAFTHADDIRTSATNLEDVSEQVSTVDTFTQSRVLKLCPEKCALLPSGHTSTHNLSITVAGSCLAVEHSVKCLGVWWDSSSSSMTSVMERINKSRSAFFSHRELGAFHGLLNPLSSRSQIEYCIIPVLMYGSESWVLNSTLLSKFKSFQAELGKRILKLPKHTSNTIPPVGPQLTLNVLPDTSKLTFLQSVLTDNPT